MLISLEWLRQYVDVPESAEQLARDLTMLGLNVEGVEHRGNPLSQFVVGKVLSCGKHPDADKLSVCTVEVGEEDPRPVVCGAPNVREGLTVSVILPGRTLPDGTKIKKTKLRGEKSEGMICSEIEMGLGDSAEGILEMDTDLPPGTPLSEIYGGEDWVLDIEVTPNRPDQLGHLGVAREVAALYERELRLPETIIPEDALFEGPKVAVELEDAAACPRYVARFMDGIKIGPSPEWIRSRLESVGLRAINNVVDITNYVLHETGHPLHVFDASEIAEERIVVRRARPDEKMITLDDEEQSLDAEDLVIADPKKIVALAGIMGGLHSGVTGDAERVILESAYFDPAVIRKTRQRLDLSTDSSYRFERGADIEMADFASLRAARLIVDHAGGRLSRQTTDACLEPRAKRFISLRPEKVVALLGRKMSAEEIAAILLRLQLSAEIEDGLLKVEIPSFRNDLEIEVDLIEEVGRLYGFNRLPVENRISNALYGRLSSIEGLRKRIHESLTGLGFQEVLTSSFMDERDLDRMRLADDDARRAMVTMINPLVSFNEKMRSTLLPGMLDVVRTNFHREEEDLRLYQMGRVYLSRDGEPLPEEPERITLLITGSRSPAHWSSNGVDVDLSDMVGAVEAMLRRIHLDYRLEFETSESFLSPGRGFRALHPSGSVLGEGGLLRPSLLSDMKPRREVYFFDFSLEEIRKWAGGHSMHKSIPAYPSLRRDLALLLPDSATWQELELLIRKRGGKLMESLELFDIYSGAGIPEGTKSYAVRLRFRSPDGTLQDEQVDQQIQRILKALKDSLNVVLRS